MTTLRPTGRWRGIVMLSLFAGAVGLLAKRPDVLFLAALGIGFATYPRLGSPPPEPDLSVERTISPESPAEAEHVDVSVTVRNEGDRWLFDLRIVDGVPALLPVVDGTPRQATMLAPGDETTVRYTIEAREGKHRFESMTVLCRDPSGAFERRTAASEPTVVDCGASVSSTVLRDRTRRRPGELVTDDGGAGIEFHRTREYRPGDPMNRIDWRRFARTGDLATIEFRQERAAAAVLCVDVGPPPTSDGFDDPSTQHAVARGILAADRLAVALADANHEVGLATLGPQSCWLSPGVGRGHLTHLRQRLDTDPAFVPAAASDGRGSPDGAGPSSDGDRSTPGGDPDLQDGGGGAIGSHLRDALWGDDRSIGAGAATTQSTGSEATAQSASSEATAQSDGGTTTGTRSSGRSRQTTELRERLGTNMQVTLLSPLADDGIVDTISVLETAGYPVFVVSPNTTTTETVGSRLATVERSTRIRALRRNGIPVVDWKSDEHLGTAIAATQERFE